MRRRSPLSILIMVAILDFIGFATLLPILPLYAEGLGANKWMMMAVMGSYSAIQFFAAPLLGRLSDHIGRKPVLLLCYLGSVISYVIFAFAHTVPVILLSRLVTGVTGGNIPVAQAYVADVTTPDKRTRGMGLIGMALGIGFILGPAGGSMAYHFLGRAAPGLLAAVMSGGAMLLAFFVLPETEGPRDTTVVRRKLSLTLIKEAFGYPLVGSILIVGLMSGTAFSTLESTFSQFLEGRYRMGPAQVGPVFAFIGVMLAVVQGGLIGTLARRFGEEKLVGVGTFVMAVALTLVPLAPGLPALMIVAALFAVGGGILSPSMSSLVPAACPAARVGAMLGVFQAMSSLGRILGPVWGQYSWGTFGQGAPYFSAGALMLGAFVLALKSVVFSRVRAGVA